MTNKSILLITTFLALAFVSCNKSTPSGFWKNYNTKFLKNNISDQGPNGGYRAMYWKTDMTYTFTSSNILDFAKKNGWTIVDSLNFTQDQTNKWIYNNQSIFPLTSKGFCDTLLNDAHLDNFPRWFGGQMKIYRFKTDWITIEPGTDKSIEENGFVLLSYKKNEMSVYHLWGE